MADINYFSFKMAKIKAMNVIGFIFDFFSQVENELLENLWFVILSKLLFLRLI